MTYRGSKVGESSYWAKAGSQICPGQQDGQIGAHLSGHGWSRVWGGVVLPLALLGCASSTAPAESPTETNSSYEESTPSEDAAASADAAEGESTATDTQSASTAPASEEDLKQALQVVIQDESLLSELKLGEPGRFPLKIAGQSLSSGLELKAHSEAVEVVSAPADPKSVAVLIFTNIDITNSQGTFKYRYDVEGMRGTSYVEKNDQGVWELKSSRVSEY